MARETELIYKIIYFHYIFFCSSSEQNEAIQHIIEVSEEDNISKIQEVIKEAGA